jgi:hypothetical protein
MTTEDLIPVIAAAIGIVLVLPSILILKRLPEKWHEPGNIFLVILIACSYPLFSLLWKPGILGSELLLMLPFVIPALLLYRQWPLISVLLLATHGVWDYSHHLLISNPGIPEWWAPFCAAYDFALAIWIARDKKLFKPILQTSTNK